MSSKEEKRIRGNRKNLWIILVSVIAVVLVVSMIGTASSRISNLEMTEDSAALILGNDSAETWTGTASFQTGARSTSLKQFKFVSEDPSIASVRGMSVENKLVTFEVRAVSPGMTTVYIETNDGTKSNALRVSVSETDAYPFEKYIGKPVSQASAFASYSGYTKITVLDDTDGKELDDTEDYILVSISSANLDTKTVVFRADTQEHLQQKAHQKELNAALEKKLPYIRAFQAAEQYGKKKYPYGFELHYMMGQQAADALDENTWHLRATCTITNKAGKETKMDCDSTVTGTESSPKVLAFQIEKQKESSANLSLKAE